MALHKNENDQKWGVSWVGGVLYYDSEAEARSKRHAFGQGEVIPPGSTTPKEG